jgi:hypothetical protein
MVVTGKFTKAKMAEVLTEISSAKKYVILDLSPMTGDIFDLEFLQKEGMNYIVSLKLPGATKSIITGTDGYFFGYRFSSLTYVTFQNTIPSSGFSASYPFLGDLRAKFYTANPANGTPGTYKTTAPVSNRPVWIKQP